MKKEEFLIQIQKILNLFDELEKEINKADKMCEEQPEQKSEIDKLISDYLHVIEDEELDANGYKEIGERIHAARKIRRDQEWVFNLMKAYTLNKNKLMISPRANREMFKSTIEKTLKGLDTTYNYRILTEEDINKIKNKKETKKTPKTKYDIEKIKNYLEDGMTMTQIAKELGTSQPQISYLVKKFGLKIARRRH